MAKNKYAEFNRVVRFLKKNLPTAMPVSVRRLKMKKHDGLCIRQPKRFLIKIDNTLSQERAIETLLHEFSHVLSWLLSQDSANDEEFNELAHGESWGCAYAKIYRLYEKEFCT